MLFLLISSFLSSALAQDPIVTLRNGSYSGVHLPQFDQDIFLGIPYAQNTGGPNRFRIPQSLNTTWTGTREAKAYGNACPDANPDMSGSSGMSEDCLSINVVRPAGIPEDANLPVAMWVHGGSYQVGSSSRDDYNLTYFVERSMQVGKPIVATSINYRKGGWGNMYSIEIQGSGNTNLALRDMRKALAWISENIPSFGGNKDKVTIWGESSGSFAVGQLLLSYGGDTDNLFHHTIQESGSATTAWCNGSDWYQPIYDKIVSKTNCSDAPDTLDCLRTVPYERLYPLLNYTAIPGPGWYPTVDGDIYPEYPTQALALGRFAHLPHLYGTNSDEGSDNAPVGVINTDADLRSFLLHSTGFDFPPSVVSKIMSLYPDDPTLGIPLNTGTERFADLGWQYKRAAAIVGDVFYHGPRLSDARQYTAHGDPTYIYRFNTRPFENATNATYTDNVGSLAPAYRGVPHFGEVAYVFNNPQFVGPWAEHRALSERMSEMWVNFVNHGDPNGEGLPAWPRYDDGGDGKGRNLVLQKEDQGGMYVEEDTWRLEGREYLTKWARRRHV